MRPFAAAIAATLALVALPARAQPTNVMTGVRALGDIQAAMIVCSVRHKSEYALDAKGLASYSLDLIEDFSAASGISVDALLTVSRAQRERQITALGATQNIRGVCEVVIDGPFHRFFYRKGGI